MYIQLYIVKMLDNTREIAVIVSCYLIDESIFAVKHRVAFSFINSLDRHF